MSYAVLNCLGLHSQSDAARKDFFWGEGGGDVHLFMSSDIKNALEAILGYYGLNP